MKLPGDLQVGICTCVRQIVVGPRGNKKIHSRLNKVQRGKLIILVRIYEKVQDTIFYRRLWNRHVHAYFYSADPARPKRRRIRNQKDRSVCSL